MIYLNNISLSFADRKIFDNIAWMIPEKSRIGLVGDNGAGKTTLFKAILGTVDLDDGAIDIPNRKNRTIGYLPQDLVELEPLPLMDYLRKKSGIAEIEETLKEQESRMSRCDPDSVEYHETMKAYEASAARFQSVEGYRFEAKAGQILGGFGFREKDFSRNCTDFSGGWKMRILIALILLSNPDIMLLDEPTNHLDTESMEWLESYLKNYHGTLITIAHDRVFLDKIVNQIVELSNHRLTVYKGNYSYYLAEKERRLDALKKQMELQRSEIKKTQEFIERFRYKATKSRQVQSRIRMLERFEIIELERQERKVHIQFPEAPKSGREVVSVRQASKNYGDVTVFSSVDLAVHRGEKIAMVGVNGAGKSTLARLLSGMEEPSSGTVTYGLHVSMAFFSQESAGNLDYRRTVWDEVLVAGSRSNDQERRNLLGAFLFSGDDIYKEISVLSGGEKSRLALLKILLQDSNLLILDEPTNHLDLKTKDIFQSALLSYSGTVVIVSHDRFFLDRLVHRVIEIRDGQCHEYLGNYSYFIQKRAELSATAPEAPVHRASQEPAGSSDMGRPSAAERPPDGKDGMPGRKTFKSKEEKRLEAEVRNHLSRITKVLKDDLAVVEDRIAHLEEKKGENEKTLCAPDIHKEPQKIKQLNQDLLDIARELETLYTAWDDLTQKLEA
ncbi:MAG: ABC-F family ATP-binding cassette domain-containing protein [Deltaproteobacteria bacterium]|nr:ABC-F family ATP-binding cassette domain-containing protein [Deltaproteobacteria bacterium]